MKYDLSNPWDAESMDFEAFVKLFAEAHEADKEQPKVISSLSFGIIRGDPASEGGISQPQNRHHKIGIPKESYLRYSDPSQ